LASQPSRAFGIPRIFVACDGRERPDLPLGRELGLFLRDLDLAALADLAGPGGWLSPLLPAQRGAGDSGRSDGAAGGPAAYRALVALDLDAVEGLNVDDAAVRFVIRHLGIPIVATRRPAAAAVAADLGGLGLVQVFAFDSTGLRRSLDPHPRRPGTGSLVSPGPVLSHMAAEDLATLPRPLVAYGLIATPALARTALHLADGIVVAPDCVVALLEEARASRPATAGSGRLPLDKHLTGD
jgi:glycerol-3-phosphate responsive antiterminator